MFVKEGFLRGRYILQMQMSDISPPGGGGGRGTPIHYLYRYVPPNRVVILKLLI